MSVNQRPHIAAATIPGVCFVILMILVWSGQTNSIDLALHDWVLGFNTPTSVAVWDRVSLFGSVAIIVIFTLGAIFIFAMRRDFRAARLIALAMGGAFGLNIILKWLVHRARPDQVYLGTMPTSYSFPSGHAFYGFTFYLAIAVIVTRHIGGNQSKVVWSAAVILVALIGASRIFLGVHFASDVLGGYLIAATWLMLLRVSTELD